MTVTDISPLLPQSAEIRKDLEYMTARWGELPVPAMFEIRAFKEGAQPKTAKFSPDWMDDAVEWAETMNELGHNVYVVRNPIRHDAKGSATDTDILASFFLWADCDSPDSASNVKKFTGPKYNAAVITGALPSTRVHVYWQLEEACTDMAAWRDMQARIASHLNSDSSVINPSRIMRIAGTVAYPDAKKRERGYQKHVTTLRTDYPDQRAPVTMDQMARVFTQSGHSQTSRSFALDAGQRPLDRERTRIQALSGQEWHNAVIRLVASYVGKGLSDDEIHGLTAPLTLAGYTPEQTAREVQTAIDGARRKGWAPEQNEFRELSQDEREAIPPAMFRPWGRKDIASIPYPEFLYSDFYARGYTSLTLASPKVGKSMLALAEALDMATGKGFLTGQAREPLRVVYYNAEDDQDVLDSRVAALLELYDIEQNEIEDRFWPTSGVEASDFFFATGQDGTINEPLFVAIEKFCTQQRADVLIFDPLQDLSASPETNEVFRAIGQRLRRMASVCGVSIGIVHHTRKIAPGAQATIEDGRGGSALRGTARFNRILNPMSEDEGVKANVDNHRFYFRIGDIESNLAPPSADVNRWFEKMSVPIANGHSIGAIKIWNWPDAFDGITRQQAARVRSVIDSMEDPPRQNIRSSRWVGFIVAETLGLSVESAAQKERVKTLVSGWVKRDVLREVEVHDPRAGRATKVIIAGANNPAIED